MRIHSWLSPKCAVRPSKIHGSGLFAVAPLGRAELVAAFGGIILTDEEIDRLLPDHPEYGWKTVSIADGLYLAPLKPNDETDDTEWLNHSCEPNLGVRGQIVLVARRDIAAGEELTFDYETTESSPRGGGAASAAPPSAAA